MTNSFADEVLPSPSPKPDEKQHLFANPGIVLAGDRLIQSSGSALSYNIQEAIDKWAGKQALYNPPSIQYFTSSKLTLANVPAVVQQPTNIAPKGLVMTGIKSIYEANSLLSIAGGSVLDGNGWKDVDKVDFWLTDKQGKRIELADATSFTAQDSKPNMAKFNYSTSLKDIAIGEYKLNAVAVDKSGAKSDLLTQAMVIKPINITPTSLAITGIKSSYEANSTLSIDSGSILDGNGWKDVHKVDFWLTDKQGKRIELADVTSFAAQEKELNIAKFNYSTSLKDIVIGEYKLNAVAIDKSGSKSDLFTQSVVIKPINVAPRPLVITGIKQSYEANSTLSIDSGYALDGNGWQDVSKVDFWLTDKQGKRVELADVTSFVAQDKKPNMAKFNYITSLKDIAAGEYKLNAVAIDKSGAKGDLFTQAMVIKPINIAPTSLAITGIKPTYDANSTLSIDSGSILDSNGWKDVDKVDFWLTDKQGKRIELADVTSFAAQDKELNTAKFNYSTSLKGIAAGEYALNAMAIDKLGAKSDLFTQTMTIKPEIPKQFLKIDDLKSSYEINSKLSFENGLILDNNGWQDVDKVDFWLTDKQGKRIELADVTSFVVKDTDLAKFNYDASLAGLAIGEYKFNGVAYDKAGVEIDRLSKSLVIKPKNIAPEDLTIEGVKPRYDSNGTLAIDIGYIYDSNGWQDVDKVDFWLTDKQGKRIELPDANKLEKNTQDWSQFQYSTSLNGIANGDYKLNAIAYDKAGAASNQFSQAFTINTLVKPDIDIKLFDPLNSFSAEQKRIFEIAANNWERIITNDKDIRGVLNIVTVLSQNDLNGKSYLGTVTGAEAYIDSAINKRSNISNDQVPTTSPVDIGGVDYDNRINVNSYYLQDKPNTLDLVTTMMHEMGHILGLEHESDSSLMDAVHTLGQTEIINSHSFDALEKLGYKIDRNAQLKWS